MKATATITLSRGRVTIVDADDVPALLAHGHKWWLNKKYAASHFGPRSSRRIMSMHRFLMNAPAGVDVDHVNGNPLDNRRANLRLCNDSQNQANRHWRRSGAASRFKGVRRAGRKWRATIRVHGKRIYLGSFGTEEEAATAYDMAAEKHFGEFAHHNGLIDSRTKAGA